MEQQNAEKLRQIEQQIKAADKAIMEFIAQDASLKARFDILVSIPGVSQINAITLLIEMPELGEIDENAAEALCGLATTSRQSKRWTERTFIAGGRVVICNALYMRVLIACRFDPELKAKYDRLKAAGKAPKVATTRKLTLPANALRKTSGDGRKDTDVGNLCLLPRRRQCITTPKAAKRSLACKVVLTAVNDISK